MTVNVWPAMTIAPLRAAPLFTEAENDTLPLPLPLCDPSAIAIQSAPVVAVHEQLLPVAVSVTDPGPPADVNDCPADESVYVHGGGGGGGAACVTVNVFPATEIVPVRSLPVFGATLNATGPEPVLDAPEVMLIHGAVAAAVHAHVGAEAVTAIDPDPPVSATF